MRPPRERDFTSFLRSPAVASRVGLGLGVCFAVAFLTGLYSHWQQDPEAWFPPPTGPVWGYRLTQGLHVATGTAAIPLLLVKLWTVYPKLFAALPDLRRPGRALLTALERASIAVLVAAGIFMLATGIANSAQWYPWGFTFRLTHYALAWVAIGALVVHVAVKLPLIRSALGDDVDSTANDRAGTAERATGLTRRGLVGTAYAAAAVAVLSTAGASLPLLRKVSVFGVRSGDGPGGVPINRSASAARVTASATSGDYRLVVAHGEREVELDLARLTGMRRHTYDLPIACVEGWSAQGTWSGPRVRDLMALVDAPEGADVVVTSLQESGPYTTTLLPGNFAGAENTLLATHLAGERLSLDHGFPCRVIAPNRPGVLQTKWVRRLEVRA